MRQFSHGWDYTPVDIVIEEDGQVWVSITEPTPWAWNAYEKIEDIRAKDYRRPGSTRGRARPGSGARSGRASDGYARSRGFNDAGYEFDRERDPLVDSMAVHVLLENWFGKQSKDDFPLSGGVA